MSTLDQERGRTIDKIELYMNKQWYKDCKTDEAKKERSHVIVAAAPAINVLKNVVLEYLRDLEYNQTKSDLYNNPNWAFMQADSIGQRRAYEKLLALLTIEE